MNIKKLSIFFNYDYEGLKFCCTAFASCHFQASKISLISGEYDKELIRLLLNNFSKIDLMLMYKGDINDFRSEDQPND